MLSFLRRKLTKKGIWYDPAIFTSEQPGTAYNYSNLSITLLAFIIKIQTGKSYDKYEEETLSLNK